MYNITAFTFDTQEIEVVLIDDQPWFHASQVAKALGYSNPSKSLRDNVSTKYNQQLDLGRRGSTPNFISEPGLYQLIMRSTLPAAQRFQDWVFEEVLPAIRKSGKYETPHAHPAIDTDEVKTNMELIGLGLGFSGLHRNLISGVVLNYAGKCVPSLASAVNEAHQLLAANTPTDLLLTPTKIGEALGISAKKVNLLLLDLGYQTKNTKTSKGDPAYLPTEDGKRYSSNTLATGKLYSNGADNTTYQHLKWDSSIIDILRPHVEEVK